MSHSSNVWPKVTLNDVLRKSENWISIDPDAYYQEVTVRLWGKGVVERKRVIGADIAAARRLRVNEGQFIISRIDARNGAFGVIPPELSGAVVSNDFPTFDLDPSKVLPQFMGWVSRTKRFVKLCQAASEGTTNRVRLSEEKFLNLHIAVPPLEEQRRVVEQLQMTSSKIEAMRATRADVSKDAEALLQSTFYKIHTGAPRRPMGSVAPLVRRAVAVDLSSSYPELGIRSFGRGTFHKPAVVGGDVGTKKLFRIEPGDLLFNIVFAWEGAVAVARAEDAGRVGSHRFLTCVPQENVATAPFLCFYFSTPEGLERLGQASPGGAGRNRTLGLKALENIAVPVPPIEQQRWFDALQRKVGVMREVRQQTNAELDALLPSVLDRVFSGRF